MDIPRPALIPSPAVTGPVEPEPDRRGLGPRLLVAAGLVCLGCLFLSIDVPVAAWCRAHRLSGDLGRLVELSEVFGHALGAAVILGVAVTLDPALRRARRLPAARWDVGRLVIAAYAGGLVVDALKLTVTRVRPRAAEFASIGSVFDTFGTTVWRAAGEPEVALKLGKAADLMSFPSGHAAVAAGLATALAWKYPHGRLVFAALAAAAAVQRVVSSAHYPSDVAFGAACGVAVAAVCLGVSRPVAARMAAGTSPC